MHEINWIWRVKIIHFYICSCYFESNFHALYWFDLFFLALWMMHSGSLVESGLMVKAVLRRCDESETGLGCQGKPESLFCSAQTPLMAPPHTYTNM